MEDCAGIPEQTAEIGSIKASTVGPEYRSCKDVIDVVVFLQ
jgi:hypothetical protein